MGPASLQEEREPEQESKGEMESYRSLLQAGSQLESTLQQVTVPLSMKEVGGYIEKQVAYLSGGRGEDSSVIITLPECSAFTDIPEESLAKVLTYLTLIPRTRQPGVKFIIILDRRLDTWASIKTALARIASIQRSQSHGIPNGPTGHKPKGPGGPGGPKPDPLHEVAVD